MIFNVCIVEKGTQEEDSLKGNDCILPQKNEYLWFDADLLNENRANIASESSDFMALYKYILCFKKSCGYWFRYRCFMHPLYWKSGSHIHS